MLNLSVSVLAAVVEQALKDASQHPRWTNAIRRAFEELDSNPFIERSEHGLLIGSPSGQCYSANGVCSCQAYEYGNPCWHRAASRIVRLHDEKITTTQERAAKLTRAAAAEAALNECFA